MTELFEARGRRGALTRGALGLGLLVSTALISPALLAAHAQPLAAAARVVSFNIPAGSLSAAMVAFSRQAGLQVSYTPDIASGIETPGVTGPLTVADALTRLLAGTGLSYRFANASSITISRPTGQAGGAPAGSIALDTIDVQGDADGTFGFVATRSSAGTKTDTPLIEVPQSISVVTRDQMDVQAVQEVNQALRYEAGVRTEMSVINRAQEINIRGFQVDGSAQGMYLDGLSLPTRWYGHYNINPYALESIEILRGPSSVMYGQNGPGGIVNMTSKRPTDTPLREIELTTGSYDKLQGAFDIGGPADAKGEWLYRLTGEIRDVGSQVDFTDTTRGFIAPALTWRPNADTSLTLLASYQELDRNGGSDQWLPAVGTITPTLNGFIPRDFFSGEPGWDEYTQQQAMIGYQFEHRFDENWTIRQNARYSHLDTDYQALITYGWGANADGSTDYNALNRYAFASQETADTFVIDNQVQYTGSTGALDHTILAGLDYKYSVYDTVLGIGFDVPAIDPFNPVYGQSFGLPETYQDNRQVQTQLGLYAQDQIKINDRLIFLLAGRYDWAETETENHLANDAISTQDDGAFTWRTGAVYLLDNGFAPYVSYSTSFVPQAGTDYYGNAFEPTTGQAYEVGVKYQPAGFAGFVTASVFHITKQNVPTLDLDHLCSAVPQPANCGNYNVQVGEVRSQGFELEGKVSLTDSLDLIASYTYIDLVTTESNSSDLGKVPYAAVPRNMASAWANYTLQTGAFRGLGFGGGLRYVGETTDDGIGAVTVPSVTLVDAMLRYDLSALDSKFDGALLSINATNLFDKTYVASCNNDTTCFYGPGRTVTASLRYRW